MKRCQGLFPDSLEKTSRHFFHSKATFSPVGIMPKQKTHKGMKKRFKLTASGKVKFRRAFRGHLLSHKNGKRIRQLRQDGVIEGAEATTIQQGLRPSS